MPRRLRPRAFFSLAIAALALSSPASAQEASDGSSLDQRLNELQKELGQLRQENAAMRAEVQQLREENGDKWLTEQRAEQIRSVVNDVLADADTRASLLDTGIMAGWVDHFFLASPDGRFKLIFEGQEQIRFIYNHHDQVDRHRWGFENTRTRLTFRGHVYSPDLTYLVRLDLARAGGADTLLDAWVRWHFTDHWHLRVGQFKLPFNREELVSSAMQLAVERSLVNETMNLGRSQGVELEYIDSANRFSIAFSDGVSANLANLLGGPRTNTTALTEDTEFSFVSRYERLLSGSWDQFEDFTSPQGEEFGVLLGLGGYWQQSEANGQLTFDRNEVRALGYTADISVEWGGANVFLSGFHHYIDSPQVILNWFGVVGQAGVYISPKVELFLRGEWALISVDGPGLSELNTATVGVNYYIQGHDVKFTTDINVGIYQIEGPYVSDLAGFRADADGVWPQVVIRSQIQVLF